MNSLIEEIKSLWSGNFILVSLTAVASFIQLAIFYRSSLKDLTVSYRIAVIGLPRAGKTALIGAIFDRIFSSGSGRSFSPVGQETINRINRVIANLNSLRPLPPTKEKDAFVFRFLYYIKRTFIFKGVRYEGEVVDFPGELSQQLLESAGDGDLSDDISIFHKEFFSWVISSRVHLFVVDLGQFLLADDRNVFVAQISSEIRAAWQLLNEEINRSISPPERRVALVFTKADLLTIFPALEVQTPEQKILLRRVAFEAPAKDDGALDTYDYSARYKIDLEINQSFIGLIRYFNSQECNFAHFKVATYSVGLGNDGIDDLINFILPEPRLGKRSFLSRIARRF